MSSDHHQNVPSIHAAVQCEPPLHSTCSRSGSDALTEVAKHARDVEGCPTRRGTIKDCEIASSTSRNFSSLHVALLETENSLVLPSVTAGTTTTTSAMASAMIDDESSCATKPFFIMDWLEQVDPERLKKAQDMLQQVSQAGQGLHHSPQNAAAASTIITKVRSFGGLFGSDGNGVSKQEPVTAYKPLAKASKHGSSTPNNRPPTQQHERTDSFYRERSIQMGNLWNTRGLSMAKCGLWIEAIACWQDALEIRTQMMGEIHLDVANTCNNIGIAHCKLFQAQQQQGVDQGGGRGNNAGTQALPYLMRALEIRLAVFGTHQHTEVAATLHNLGNVWYQCGALDQAVACYQQSRAIHAAVLGPKHVHVARVTLALGHVYDQMQLHEAALSAFQEAVHILELCMSSCGDDAAANGSRVRIDPGELQSARWDLRELELMLETGQENDETKAVKLMTPINGVPPRHAMARQ